MYLDSSVIAHPDETDLPIHTIKEKAGFWGYVSGREKKSDS